MKPIYCTDTGEICYTYQQYLYSEHWKNLKLRYEQYYPKVCRTCGTPYNVQLHHKTYDRVGNENLSDLTYLCRGHHQLTHHIKNNTFIDFEWILKIIIRGLIRALLR